jgi:hypothetical protein
VEKLWKVWRGSRTDCVSNIHIYIFVALRIRKGLDGVKL